MTLRKTKIVCSIGPACDNDQTIRQMILSGMNIARFNFSHGSYDSHREAMNRVKRISSELNIPVGLLLDTKGPEIRTGLTPDNMEISIQAGEKVEVTSDDSLCTQKSDSQICHISISWKEAASKLKKGHKILIADGLIELEVDEILPGQNEKAEKGENLSAAGEEAGGKNTSEAAGKEAATENSCKATGISGNNSCSPAKILCTAKNSGKISSRKNVNLKGVHAGLPIMSEKDMADLRFGAEMDVDFVAASFLSFPEEVVQIKNYLKEIGLKAKVIAKIESEEGVDNIKEIVKEADGVMVARGDLGVQLSPERIPLVQKMIIKTCRQEGKPVITATQMLDSMIVNPRPTRAELTDVSNAVFDGTDAVMLSGETAGGKYPVEAVKTMAQITSTTEESEEYRTTMKNLDAAYKPGTEVGHMVMHSAYKLARNIKAKAIIIPTMHGNTARTIGSYRPEQIIIGVTPKEKVQRQLTIQWGVVPVLCDVAEDSESMIQNAVNLALKSGAVQLSDKVVMCAGIPLSSPLMANTIKVLIVGNVLARGTDFGSNNPQVKKAGGRVIQAKDLSGLRDGLKDGISVNRNTVLVCEKITEELLPILRIVDGVVSEGGSEISAETLSYVNKDLVWILHARHARKYLESNLTVTLDGEQGLVYEGMV